MKRFLLLLSLIATISFTMQAQNLTFEQVQSLRKKDLGDVETFLASKGWSMTSADEGTDQTMGRASFGYEVDRYDNERALAWLTFFVSTRGNEFNRLRYQVHKTSTYNSLLGRLAPNGYKLIKTQIVDDGIEKVYKNSTVTCVVTTSTSEGLYSKGTTYSFFFIDNDAYLLNYEE